jgi:hypothetical protein
VAVKEQPAQEQQFFAATGVRGLVFHRTVVIMDTGRLVNKNNQGIAWIGGRISSAAHGPRGLIYTPLRPDTQCCYSRAAIKKEKKLPVTSKVPSFYCCHPISIY